MDILITFDFGISLVGAYYIYTKMLNCTLCCDHYEDLISTLKIQAVYSSKVFFYFLRIYNLLYKWSNK
jgi:hypothetical protein